MANINSKNMRVCVINFPMVEAGVIPLAQLIDILHATCQEVHLITGDAGYKYYQNDKRIHTLEIKHEGGANLLTRAMNYALTQLKISRMLLGIATRFDVCFFFIGGEGLLLPTLMTRLLGKKAVLALVGFPGRSSQAQRDPLAKITDWLSRLNLGISNRIVVYSERIVEERGLAKYRSKVSIADERFLDLSKFSIKKPLAERGNLVGYVGRLSEEKGILNLMEAIPQILEKMGNSSFSVVGDGPLRGKVEEYLQKASLESKVKLTGWTPHDELPPHLNKLKLLVLPSYTEGLPNIILEAMACGTPVLAAAVGAVPDVITDNETGFLMENNSPASIASGVIKALNHPHLEQIAKNARLLIEKEYNFKAAVERYKRALAELR